MKIYFNPHLLLKIILAIRGVIPTDDIFCVSGCGHVETAEHLFLSCPTFASLWKQVRDWIGFVGVDSNIIADHLMQFTHLTSVGKAKSSFMQLIWLLCSWVEDSSYDDYKLGELEIVSHETSNEFHSEVDSRQRLVKNLEDVNDENGEDDKLLSLLAPMTKMMAVRKYIHDSVKLGD
ncbi:hypothetical protein MTR_4g122170 [Medicago truncatula]|uniref:Reverse transcriptase zinc-binding domain-containing protein n=1 Tax=Medicago truncatula TaxID=3880 RepID=G7JNX2_MEDTR|nr:hypothetical protein MTR_4g122170 [Medicago truncatula]